MNPYLNQSIFEIWEANPEFIRVIDSEFVEYTQNNNGIQNEVYSRIDSEFAIKIVNSWNIRLIDLFIVNL